MLDSLRAAIHESQETSIMESLDEIIEKNEIRDEIVQDPELIGEISNDDEDPEIAKLIDTIPESTDGEVTPEDIEELTESLIPETITKEGKGVWYE